GSDSPLRSSHLSFLSFAILTCAAPPSMPPLALAFFRLALLHLDAEPTDVRRDEPTVEPPAADQDRDAPTVQIVEHERRPRERNERVQHGLPRETEHDLQDLGFEERRDVGRLEAGYERLHLEHDERDEITQAVEAAAARAPDLDRCI